MCKNVIVSRIILIVHTTRIAKVDAAGYSIIVQIQQKLSDHVTYNTLTLMTMHTKHNENVTHES